MRRATILLALLAACGGKTTVPDRTQDHTPPDDGTRTEPPDEALVPPTLRLPTDVRPTKIALELTIDPTQASFTGTMTAQVEVTTATKVVWLNARGLKIDHAAIDDASVGIDASADDFVGLISAGTIAPGTHTVTVAYTAPIDHEKSLGVYAENEGDATYAYTFFEPVDARRAFPCWDEPSFKIPWTLTFHVKETDVALANAAVVRETPEDGGMKKVELAESKPLPSYLVAFVVGPFELVDGGTGGRAQTPIRFIIPKGRGAELRYAKEVTPKVVAALEDYFDMDYPYGKLDVAVVPRFWGTMEHPGIVAMGQPLTLIPPDQETRERRQSYANILAHELGHYWFGDYVTMAWWDDTWLNEAMGEWLDMRITDVVEPSWHYPEERVGMAQWGMGSDEVLSARQIRQPVTSLEGIQASFDNGITYAKGSVVMRMFEHYVGEDAWREFLRAYMRAYAWKNATADDFLGAMKTSLGAEVSSAVATFLDQPGVPLIERDGCKLTQRRALPAGTVDDGDHAWSVPVCVKTKAGEQCVMLGKEGATLELPDCDADVLLNRGAYGYYRAAYTVDQARALLAAPKKKAKAWLTSAERRSVVGDVSAAVDRAEIPVGDALALVPTLVDDADVKVVATGLSLIGLVRGGALDDATYAKLKKFAVKALGPLAKQLGWTRAKKDSDDRHALRLEVVPWVATSGDAKLAAEATKLARKWLSNRKAVADDVAGAALGVAVAVGDATLFDDVLAAAKASTEHREQQRLVGALGRFRDPELAKRALALVVSGDFDFRDAQSIVFGVLTTRETRDLAWRFVLDNLDGLLAQMREDEAGWALSGLTSVWCDPAHRDEAVAELGPRAAKIAGAQQAYDTALEGVDQCITAQARNLEGIQAFLAKY